MRIRTMVLIVAIVLMVGFAALNMDEFTRPALLSLGFTTVQAPLGLVMLVILAAALLLFLASTLYIQSAHLIENRQTARELHAQRDLADKAEASRFTELRSYLEAQALAAQQREAAHVTVMSERVAQSQQALAEKIDQSGNTLAAYIGELEDRLENRDGVPRAPVLAGSPVLR
ncbi:MAG: hypothetical protein H0W47_01435 [Polaromonas sp.]|uniref:hypothetical protein n=1 Tax=Polaromonas sp. TaxID=1869339 RepID=UPI0017A6C791|nr:hypothetical protein [Polaromonas sp.]MBA3592448.1 hypothetical protein [Polaromonas sp.]